MVNIQLESEARTSDLGAAVDVLNLSKTYAVKHKQPGLRGSLRSLFRPDFSSLTAVDAITFAIQRGETVGFVGPNGAGKSTTIKMLTGILFPSGGSARVLGMVPWAERQRLAFRIASVFGQRSQLWYHLPAADSFHLLSKIYELDGPAYRRQLASLVERFGLKPNGSILHFRHPAESRTDAELIERQRVAF